MCLKGTSPSPTVHFDFPRPLVRTSATISSEGRYFNLMGWFFSASRMKWYLMSICLVLEWWTGLCANFAAPWLSFHIVTLALELNPSSFKKLIRWMASFVTSVIAIYSASVDESATVRCFLDSQEIAAPPRIKMDSVYDFLSVASLPQSASTYPMSSFPFLSNTRP